MFQTEIILFFQSFASDGLTAFLKFFTEIGKGTYAAPIVLVVMFGISFRAGFILLHAVSWNGLLTFSFKELFQLPRPSSVDFHVRLLGETGANLSPFESMGARHFFGGLPREVIESFRLKPFDTWGFPSGHASHAVTLWGSLSLYLKKVWFTVAAVGTIFFISLSRMYLGRHFLADVLGGLLLGGMITAVFYFGIYRNRIVSSLLFEKKRSWPILSAVGLVTYFCVVPILVLFIPGIPTEQVAILLGVNLGFLRIRLRGIPMDSGTFVQRIGRVLLAVLFFLSFYSGLEKAMNILLPNEPPVVTFLRIVLSLFLAFVFSVEISVKLHLYTRS